jgi:hypothetical protein
VPFKSGRKSGIKSGIAAMAELFGHEKLIVYQKGMRFAVFRRTLLARLPKRVAACDHLDRGAESILINIAHASNLWAPKERIAYKAAIQSSALVNLAAISDSALPPNVDEGRGILRSIAAMLTSLSKVASREA